MKRKVILLAALWLNVFLVAASSPSQQIPVIVVDIETVADQVAKNIRVDASKLPLTVQAPLEVAAEVCGMDKSVLRAQGQSGAVSCAATTTSRALERIVRSKIGK
jgi:hypothetical protein